MSLVMDDRIDFRTKLLRGSLKSRNEFHRIFDPRKRRMCRNVILRDVRKLRALRREKEASE